MSDGGQSEEELEALQFLANNLEIDLPDLYAIDSKAMKIIEAEEDVEEIIQV